jgi:hypothetical protein
MAPAGTVNVEGAPAAPLSVDSRTNAPPAGSGPLSVTMPIGDCAPPTTLVGVSAREETVGGGEGQNYHCGIWVTQRDHHKLRFRKYVCSAAPT